MEKAIPMFREEIRLKASPGILDGGVSTSILSLMRDHWRLILSFVLGAGILASLLTIVEPKVFRAHMKLLVRTGREETVMTTGQASTPLPPTEVTEEDVNSEMELLRSHDLLEAVVLDCDLAKPAADAARRQKEVELAVLGLFKHLEIAAVRKTNVISIGYYTSSPAQASAVLRDLVSRYLAASVAAHGAPDSLKFFSDEMALAQKQMLGAQQAASNFRESAKIFDPAQERTSLVSQLASTHEQLRDTRAQIKEQVSRQSTLHVEKGRLTDRISTQVRTAVNQPLVEHLQGKLSDLTTSRVTLAAKYKANDRLIVMLDEQIASTNRQLKEISKLSPSEQTTDVNPLQQTLSAELAENHVLLQGLAARAEALAAGEKVNLTQLDRLDRQAVTLANLERTQSEAQNNYSLLQSRVEESRMAGQMDQQKIANVAVVERPVASPIPVAPSLRLNLLIGLCAGALLGFLYAWFKKAVWSSQPAVRSAVHA